MIGPAKKIQRSWPSAELDPPASYLFERGDGPVAELHRMIEASLQYSAREFAMVATQPSIIDTTIRLISQIAGWVLLAAAFVTSAILLFC